MKESWSSRHGWRGWKDVPLLLLILSLTVAWCLLMGAMVMLARGTQL